MTKKKPYFHNNWKQVHSAPAEWFAPIEYDEFMDWKVGGWEIPGTVDCIIRERNLVTDKVTEYVYKRSASAQKKLRKRMEHGESEFTICRADTIHFLTPNLIEDEYDDPLA